MDSVEPHKTRSDEGFCTPGDVAVLVLNARDLTGIWCNDRYAEIVIDPSPLVGGIAGRHLTDFSPLIGPARMATWRRVAETGMPESGTDYLVDLGGEPRLFRWAIYRPSPDIVLALITSDATPDEGAK